MNANADIENYFYSINFQIIFLKLLEKKVWKSIHMNKQEQIMQLLNLSLQGNICENTKDNVKFPLLCKSRIPPLPQFKS